MNVWCQQYLSFLQCSAEPPSLAGLTRLTRQQLLRVPFENVTTLLRYRDYREQAIPSPDPWGLLYRWQQGAGGGLCYEVSRTFRSLLHQLGYRTWSISGTITWPDSHEALWVECEDRPYLVDIGNGAPFLSPIPVETTTLIEHAGLSYRFRPESGPYLIQDRRIDQAWQPFCRLHLAVRSDADLYSSYVQHHQPALGKFMTALVLIRVEESSLWVLHNQTLTHHTAHGRHVQTLSETQDFAEVAGDVFAMPHLPITEALIVLEQLGITVGSEV